MATIQHTAAYKGTYAFVSLGCPKNLVDTERMLGRLQLEGYQLVDAADGADLVIVNTCGFIEQARQESFTAIDEALRWKREGRTRGVIVCGCLAERQKELLLAQRPDIDGLVGVFARDEVTRVADRILGHLAEQRAVFRPAPIRALSDEGRLRITPRHFAYLKISEGCDRLCTFCAIPRMRGKHVSKPIEQVVEEARQLAADGVRELILVAQDTTYYGIDLYGKPSLRELLEQLETLPTVDWIRLMYLYPMHIDEVLVTTIASSEKIVPYLDIPLQHIDDTILRRMARRVTRRETEALLDMLRQRIPGLALRTTFITGFPGETDEQFEELVRFVEDKKFERVGVFTYSLEPDTPAAALPDHLPEEVKEQRRARLMAVQQNIAFQWNKSLLGRRVDVLLDRAVESERNVFVGRTPWDAPDVDAVAYVTGQRHRLRVGQLVRCEIVGHREYDLIAVAVAPPR